MTRNNALGRTVEITTFKGIRYTGTIVSINPHNFTVTLAKVKRIGKRDSFFEFSVFRAIDIQNLYYEEDPAIVCRGPKIIHAN